MIPASHAQQSKPPLEAFFANPKIGEAVLSPDGKFVAMVISASNGRMVLAVMDLAGTEPKLLKGFVNGDVFDIHWINNERLAYSTTDEQVAQGAIGQAWPGLFAINRDGLEEKELVSRGSALVFEAGPRNYSRVLPPDAFFFDVDRSDSSNDIYVVRLEYSSHYDVKGLILMRVDSKTGHAETVQGPESTDYWLIDQAGVPRVAVSYHDGTERVHYRDPANEQWRKLAEFKALGDDGFSPAYFGSDGTLYVLARKGRDTAALYRFDFVKNVVGEEPIITVKGYDLSGEFVVNRATRKLLGVRYDTDADGTLWLDANMKKIQAAVDKALPSTINRISVARGGNTEKVLVRAQSDTQPEMVLIYDTTAGKLVRLGASHPDIDPKQMSSQEMVHYAARDGLQIPAYLTIPKNTGGKNLPLVVLVHGGPYLRGATWGWDPEVQFLASRGYAVLQPEFRGSTGFGARHFKSGWKQWGLAMQDDIADGAHWAIAQGIADPKRICIAGASYGGYATLMGLAKDPDLFHCGVEWVGVTDINLMFKSDWRNDASAEAQKFSLPVLVGDPEKDAEQLRNTSPVNLANKIKQPLLMAYGGSDYRVPIQHGQAFRDAVRPYNDKVEWIEYSEEGHGWRLVKNRVDFWTRVEKFLDANIGPSAVAAQAASLH